MAIMLISCLGPELTEDDIPMQSPTLTSSPVSKDEFIPEQTPTFDLFLVSGISVDENLNLYQDPSFTSEIIGQIPSDGISIQPRSNILIKDEGSFLQVQHNDQIGWVDYAFLAEQHGDATKALAKIGQIVLTAIKNYEYKNLEDLIHPELCLRFSPYSYLSSDNQIICGPEINSVTQSTETQFWGYFDGTGEEINLNFKSYHQRFIYDQDYFQAKVIGFNQEVSSGNSINNIPEFYPDGMMIEYHFPGIDPQYDGLDWRSIRLVFMELDSDWYLVAIIHGEWTI
jgi:hypothetical protein